MEKVYDGLHKKLGKLKRNKEHNTGTQKTQQQQHFHPRVLNLTTTIFSKEENEVLENAIERPLANNVNRIIIDMGNAINKLDEHLRKGYRIIAFNKPKQIIASNTNNTMHKIHYITKKLKQKLQDNNLTVVGADKGKVCVIIEQKIP
jgi:hypothetical protein